MRKLAGVALAAVLLSGAASAQQPRGGFDGLGNPGDRATEPVQQVPELSPSEAVAALALLAGCVAIAHGRRRRRSA